MRSYELQIAKAQIAETYLAAARAAKLKASADRTARETIGSIPLLLGMIIEPKAEAVFTPVAMSITRIVGLADMPPRPRVDAVYYPSKKDLTAFERLKDVHTVDECRARAKTKATANGDPRFARGDYECGVGPIREMDYGMIMYKETVR